MSVPYIWILKGSVPEPKLHKAKETGDKYWPLSPKCGTKLDRSCIEHEYKLSNHNLDEWCKRCFSRPERDVEQALQDKIDRDRIERMNAYDAEQKKVKS